MPTRLFDRVLLLVAYALLTLVTAWNAWNTERALDRVEEDVCATAEVVIANQVYTLAVFGQQEGVDTDAAQEAIDLYLSIGVAVEERCGPIFLDDIEFLNE